MGVGIRVCSCNCMEWMKWLDDCFRCPVKQKINRKQNWLLSVYVLINEPANERTSVPFLQVFTPKTCIYFSPMPDMSQAPHSHWFHDDDDDLWNTTIQTLPITQFPPGSCYFSLVLGLQPSYLTISFLIFIDTKACCVYFANYNFCASVSVSGRCG